MNIRVSVYADDKFEKSKSVVPIRCADINLDYVLSNLLQN